MNVIIVASKRIVSSFGLMLHVLQTSSQNTIEISVYRDGLIAWNELNPVNNQPETPTL